MNRFLLIGLLFASSQAKCQMSNDKLLNEVKTKLNDPISVSTVLSDPKYLALHPESSFRDLIKAHCDNKPLAITTANEPGKRIKVIGIVKNETGAPVTDVIVYLYQTDSRGWYAADAPHITSNNGDMGHARLFGYVKTDENGRFELHTVKPSGYPKSDLPAHIHVQVDVPGYAAFVSEFLFDDDERLKGNIRSNAEANQFLISKPEKAPAPFQQQFSYNIVLRKV
jgi:protocatechuate 3,4-dioxygenase beta subunit